MPPSQLMLGAAGTGVAAVKDGGGTESLHTKGRGIWSRAIQAGPTPSRSSRKGESRGPFFVSPIRSPSPEPSPAASVSRTNSFALKPAGQLDSATTYATELTLVDNGKQVDTPESATRHFWHFTNLVAGDAAFNVHGEMLLAAWSKTTTVDTTPNQELKATALFHLLRFDEFVFDPVTQSIPVRLSWRLEDTNGVAVPVIPSSTNFTVTLPTYVDGTPKKPSDESFTQQILFRPRNQLDSVGNRYRLIVTIAISNSPAGPLETLNSSTSPSARLSHFNGTLAFGNVKGTWTMSADDPSPASTPAGSDFVNLSIDGNGVFEAADPIVTSTSQVPAFSASTPTASRRSPRARSMCPPSRRRFFHQRKRPHSALRHHAFHQRRDGRPALPSAHRLWFDDKLQSKPRRRNQARPFLRRGAWARAPDAS